MVYAINLSVYSTRWTPQVEASMCHLRGMLMLKLNRGEIAKQCFMEALALDVKCYDAFEQLISGEMMTPEEGNFKPWAIPYLGIDCLYFCRMAIYPGIVIPFSVVRNQTRSGLTDGLQCTLATKSRRRVHSTDLHCALAEISPLGGTPSHQDRISRGSAPYFHSVAQLGDDLV